MLRPLLIWLFLLPAANCLYVIPVHPIFDSKYTTSGSVIRRPSETTFQGKRCHEYTLDISVRASEDMNPVSGRLDTMTLSMAEKPTGERFLMRQLLDEPSSFIGGRVFSCTISLPVGFCLFVRFVNNDQEEAFRVFKMSGEPDGIVEMTKNIIDVKDEVVPTDGLFYELRERAENSEYNKEYYVLYLDFDGEEDDRVRMRIAMMPEGEFKADRDGQISGARLDIAGKGRRKMKSGTGGRVFKMELTLLRPEKGRVSSAAPPDKVLLSLENSKGRSKYLRFFNPPKANPDGPPSNILLDTVERVVVRPGVFVVLSIAGGKGDAEWAKRVLFAFTGGRWVPTYNKLDNSLDKLIPVSKYTNAPITLEDLTDEELEDLRASSMDLSSDKSLLGCQDSSGHVNTECFDISPPGNSSYEMS